VFVYAFSTIPNNGKYLSIRITIYLCVCTTVYVRVPIIIIVLFPFMQTHLCRFCIHLGVCEWKSYIGSLKNSTEIDERLKRIFRSLSL